MTAARRSRKLLLPMATLLAAASIAIASGANFTSSSATAASTYATGSLSQTNSKQGQAVFAGTDLKPGDTITGTVTIANTGTLAADFTLNEVAPSNGFVVPSRLSMTIAEDGEQIFAGTFGTVAPIDLGEFLPGEERTYTYTTTLAADAPNAEQGKTAAASYRWDAVQSAGSN